MLTSDWVTSVSRRNKCLVMKGQAFNKQSLQRERAYSPTPANSQSEGFGLAVRQDGQKSLLNASYIK